MAFPQKELIFQKKFLFQPKNPNHNQTKKPKKKKKNLLIIFGIFKFKRLLLRFFARRSFYYTPIYFMAKYTLIYHYYHIKENIKKLTFFIKIHSFYPKNVQKTTKFYHFSAFFTAKSGSNQKMK